MTSTEAVTGVPFTLNGKELEADEGELLIEAAERHGVHIPRFCYHPRMKPVGMCRMCLVEVDTGRGPGLQPSCMLPVTPEMKVETESEATKEAQDGVLEFLLANHPLDCPVCDKGGECPLQDNAYAFGPGETRFVEEKRHYEKPIPISDLVHLDRERCILCDRCTRFASEVAGDALIHFIDRGSQTQVNTFPDHPFASYFSGNTVQICPVGALTSAPYRFKARPWDLDAVESTASVDTTGARVVLQSSQDKLVRVLGVDSDAVNWSWLSDKDRFSYGANNSPDRVIEPQVMSGRGRKSVRWGEAFKIAAQALRGDAGRIGAIGGSRMSLESQYAWAKLLKGVIGTDHVDSQLGDGLPAALVLGVDRATIADACQPGGVILLVGPDPKEEVPTLYLRLRHAIVEDGASLIEMTPRATSLSDLATTRLAATPGTVGQVMAALADGRTDEEVGTVGTAELAAAHELLTSGRPVTMVFGRANLAESARYVADAVGALRRLVPEAQFLPTLRRGNVHGALEMGLAPGFLPGGIRNRRTSFGGWPSTPEFEGKDTDNILRGCINGEFDTIVLLGADPMADFPDQKLAAEALASVANIISVNCFVTESTALADVVLPTSMWGEYDGSFCNMERRVSPMRAKVTAPGRCRPDWMIAAELALAVGPDLGFATLDELRAEMTSSAGSMVDISWDDMASADDGPILSTDRNWDLEFGSPADLPTGPGYGFRLVVDRKMWDEGTTTQKAEGLGGLAPSAAIRLAPADVQLMELSGNDVVTIDQGDFQVELPFVSDPAVIPRTAWLPARLPGFDVRRLVSAGRSITQVRLHLPERNVAGDVGNTGKGDADG